MKSNQLNFKIQTDDGKSEYIVINEMNDWAVFYLYEYIHVLQSKLWIILLIFYRKVYLQRLKQTGPNPSAIISSWIKFCI